MFQLLLQYVYAQYVYDNTFFFYKALTNPEQEEYILSWHSLDLASCWQIIFSTADGPL